MLIKAICLLTTSLSFIYTNLPPPSSKTVTAAKDKIHNEGTLISLALGEKNIMPRLAAWANIIETAVYLGLMISAANPIFRDIPSIQELRILRTWHIVATIISFAGL